MKKVMKKKTKLNLTFILTLLSILASIFLIYQVLLLGPIEKMIRYILVIIIVIVDVFLLSRNFRVLNKKKEKYKYKKSFIGLMILFIIVNVGVGLLVNKGYSTIGSINKNKITYTTYLIEMAKNPDIEIDSIKKKKIGLLHDENSIDNYIIAKEIVDEHKLEEANDVKSYEDIEIMLNDLYSGTIDYMFVSSNYDTMFRNIEKYQNIVSDVKVIDKKEKTVKKEEAKSDYIHSDGKSLTKPFTILLMGVDSEKDGLDKNAAVNGDSLILITFNPNTLNATMLTVPRDSYVPIQCFKDKRENKLTHAAWYGASCMMDTIKSFLDINIDYYFKINFKGMVKLIDEIGGIEVEVPRNLCTDSSSRVGKVCIKKGLQTLNGEGALVLARNRHDMPNGDLDRGQNQQLVVKAILDKLKTINSIGKISSIIDTISNNLDTNLTVNQMLSFYDVGKDILLKSRNQSDEIFNIEHLYLEGSGQIIYDSRSNLSLWNYILNKQSISDVTQEMKRNLEIEDVEIIKDCSFSIDKPYSAKIIGKGPYNQTTTFPLLPNFIGKDKSEVEKWASEHKVKVTYETVTDNNSEHEDGAVSKQNYPYRTRLDNINKLVVTVVKKTKSSKVDCSNISNKNDICSLPSFIGMTKDEVASWQRKFVVTPKITYNEVDIGLYQNAKTGHIVGQNYKVSTHLSKIDEIELTIVTK